MRKKEFSSNVVTRELWRKFQNDNPEYKNIKWTEFYEIWLLISKELREEVVNNPLGVKLPFYTGEIKLQFLPYKFKAVNYAESSKLGKRITNANLMNRGKTATIKWERRWAVKFNKILQFFAFNPHRDIGKLAKERIDENPNTVRISRNTLGGKSKWRSIKYEYQKRINQPSKG